MQDGQVEQSDGEQENDNDIKHLSQTDAGPLNKKSKQNQEEEEEEESKLIEIPAVVGRDDEEYNMGHPRRGIAVIFNHIKFQHMQSRDGTEEDVKALKTTLMGLDFTVRVYNDLTHKKILTVLSDTAAEDHGECDCLLVVVMTHGDPGYLHAIDTMYPVQQLWLNFTGEKCPSLAGKPKLFFIQACRGTKTDTGLRMRMRHEVDSNEARYTIPNFADFLIAFSTAEGHYSWRDPGYGTWFIQALCEELQTNGRSRELLTILTFVCRRVAVNYQSFVPGNSFMDRKKQIPAITTMLTRLVYFRQKK